MFNEHGIHLTHCGIVVSYININLDSGNKPHNSVHITRHLSAMVKKYSTEFQQLIQTDNKNKNRNRRHLRITCCFSGTHLWWCDATHRGPVIPKDFPIYHDIVVNICQIFISIVGYRNNSSEALVAPFLVHMKSQSRVSSLTADHGSPMF